MEEFLPTQVWLLDANWNPACTGSNRNPGCSHIDGGSTEEGCTRQCLSYQRRDISSDGIMAVHCCCLVSKETGKLMALD